MYKMELLLLWRVIVTLLLWICCVFGDKFANYHFGIDNPLVRALSDNLVHGSLGALCWIFGRGVMSWRVVAETFVCGVCSSLVDVDHFIQAQSFRLQDATNLSSRPPFHCTTLLILPILMCKIKPLISTILIVAVSTHQLRDSIRRGLWFWPLSSTPPLPYLVYLGLMGIIVNCYTLLLSRDVRLQSVLDV